MENIIDTICAKADEASIRQAGQILKRGGLVAFPTETVYGLGADALNEDAAAKIYAAKGRPSDNPLIVHITERKMLDGIVSEVSPQAELLMEKFWPGPMTLIFKKSDLVPYGTTGGLDTVAVRMPSHPIARAVIDAGGGYIAAPSANTSGRPSPTKASHVEEDLCGKIDMILDGGEVDIGLESTSYAPKADLKIVEGREDEVIAAINRLVEQGNKAGEKVGVIATEETKGLYEGGIVKSIGSRKDELSIARHLFGILRDFDELKVDRIYSEAFDTPRMGPAIMNRLMKAAGPQVISLGEKKDEKV